MTVLFFKSVLFIYFCVKEDHYKETYKCEAGDVDAHCVDTEAFFEKRCVESH